MHLKRLTEYYKYHEDLPRVFMMPLAKIIHKYFDKIRRVKYFLITKMLSRNTNNLQIDPEKKDCKNFPQILPINLAFKKKDQSETIENLNLMLNNS